MAISYLSLGHQRRQKSKAVLFPLKDRFFCLYRRPSISKASDDLQLIILLFSYSKFGTTGASFNVHIPRCWRANLELQLYQLSCPTVNMSLLRKMPHNVSPAINMCLSMKGLAVPASFALGCDLLCVSHLVLYATMLSLPPSPINAIGLAQHIEFHGTLIFIAVLKVVGISKI